MLYVAATLKIGAAGVAVLLGKGTSVAGSFAAVGSLSQMQAMVADIRLCQEELASRTARRSPSSGRVAVYGSFLERIAAPRERRPVPLARSAGRPVAVP